MKQTIQESTELIPKKGDPNVGYRIFSILAEIIEDKESRGLTEKWNRASELTRNKHWKNKTGKPGLVTANLIFAHRQRTVNMLTDNNPTFNVSRMGQEDEAGEDFSDKVLRLAEFWWNDQEQQSVLEKSVGAAEEAGACVEKVIFNPDLEMGGEVEAQNIPLFNFGVYPVKTIEMRKAEAMVHYYPMSLRESKRKWPEHADKIVGDEDILKEIGDNRREISSNSSKKDMGYLSTFLSTVKNIVNPSGSGLEGSDEVLIVEIWVKDYTEAPVGEPQQDPTTGEMQQMYAPMYKGNIRRIRTCNAGRIVLDDMDNPSINPNIPYEKAINCYLYDKFPFNLAQSVTDYVSIFGMSDYEQLEQLNIEVDKTLSQMTIIKDKASRLKLINPKDSGVPNEHFTNKPGIINPTNSFTANALRYMDNPKIPAELTQFLEIYKDLFFTVSGSFDMEQANSSGRDVIAYKAIATLIERASTMLKGKIRNYSKLVRERGRMYVSLAQCWYTEERWITYEDNGEETAMPITGTDILFPAKISVVSGSTLPRARVQEREEAIALFKMGAIDDEELFKKLDWPNRKSLIMRKRQGPLGELMKKLQALGTPQQLLQVISQLAMMDEKEFAKAAKSGQLPNILMLIQQIMGGQQGPNLQDMQQQVEIKKTQSEIMLNAERVKTEQVKQLTAVAGIQFDAESLKQNWAKIQAVISDQSAKNLIGATETGIKMGQAVISGQHNEKGMQSNNKVE